MPSPAESLTERCVLATVVLYRRAPAESQSLCSILQLFRLNPRLAKYFSLVVYDNSPDSHALELSMDIPCTYVHQPENGGLATAYNFALERAEENRQQWLLLLDQDTTLSEGFLHELLEGVANLGGQSDVASIVPKIILGNRTLSPERNFIERIRHPFTRAYGNVGRDLVGIQPGGLVAYNSGAALRVAALRSIGGFPQEFWLDYLDHAVFFALAAKNYRMYVMREVIEHEPSQAKVSDVPVWRQRNILAAQTLFLKQHGSFVDRLLYRLWILRDSRGLWVSSPHRQLWKEALVHAAFLRTSAKRAPKP